MLEKTNLVFLRGRMNTMEKGNGSIFAKEAHKGDTRGRRMFHAEGIRGEGGSGTLLGAQTNSAEKETGAYHKGFCTPLPSP